MDRGVIAAATELFEARHYPGVVATCSDALDDEPDCVPLRMLRARALLALRRDLEAQQDLRGLIRIDPRCGLAYRLLGELAARRDEHESAAIFFREALRLDPEDREAADWLMVVDPSASVRYTGAPRPASLRPAAAVNQLPANAAAAGRVVAPRPARGTDPGVAPTTRFARLDPSDALADLEPPTCGFPRGTHGDRDPRAVTQPADERPTRPFARGREAEVWRTPGPSPSASRSMRPARIAAPERPTIPRTLCGQPAAIPPAAPAPRRSTPPRGITPEAPGFGEYLVETGILTRERLRAAQAYQRSMRVQLSTAIVTLGLATPQRIEWAAVAHQSSLPRR